MDGKNKSKQEAYTECIQEYNDWAKDKWAMTYSECYPDSGNPRVDHATPGSKGLQVQQK